jgi:hypothetical protein
MPAKTKAQKEQEALLAAADEGSEDLIDLSGVEEVRFTALPAGKYLAEVVECERATVKNGDNKGAPKLVIRWAVSEDADGEAVSKTLFDHRTLTGKGAGVTKARLEDMGVDTSQPIKPSEIVGIQAYLTVSVRKDRDTDNNIDKVELADEVEDDEALN